MSAVVLQYLRTVVSEIGKANDRMAGVTCRSGRDSAATSAAAGTPRANLRSQAARSSSPFSVSNSSCVTSGGVSCMEHYLDGSSKPEKSNDGFVRALTKLSALVVSVLLPRPYGRSIRRHTSPASLEKTSAPAPAGCPANSNLPASSSQPSSPKSRGAIKRRPF